MPIQNFSEFMSLHENAGVSKFNRDMQTLRMLFDAVADSGENVTALFAGCQPLLATKDPQKKDVDALIAMVRKASAQRAGGAFDDFDEETGRSSNPQANKAINLRMLYDQIANMAMDINNNEYSQEFRFQYGGGPTGGGYRASAASEFFSLLSQAIGQYA